MLLATNARERGKVNISFHVKLGASVMHQVYKEKSLPDATGE